MTTVETQDLTLEEEVKDLEVALVIVTTLLHSVAFTPGHDTDAAITLHKRCCEFARELSGFSLEELMAFRRENRQAFINSLQWDFDPEPTTEEQ